MAKLIKMPVLGQSVEEVRILRWLKAEGETVAAGEPLIEIETDKTSMEWDSPEAGVVRRLLAQPDEYVKVEAPILIVGTADEPIDNLLGGANAVPPLASTPEIPPVATASSSTLSPAPTPSNVNVVLSPRARRAADELGMDVGLLAGRGTGPRGRVQEKDVFTLRDEMEAAALVPTTARGLKASPLARAVADSEGVNLADVPPTGTGGRIVADDVRGVSTPTADPVPVKPEPAQITTPAKPGIRTVTLTGLRKRVADNLVKSVRNAPHVTLHIQADMTEAMRLRGELLPAIEKATGVRVSPTDIIVKACATALKEHPIVNAHIEGDTITLFDDVNIGLAVSLGDDGLIVPVIPNVGNKGMAQIVRDRQELVNRARNNKLSSSDISGGTFTVTNLGNYGVEHFNPIIAPPQVAILGIGAIADAVVARNGSPTVRPMMGLSLSFDHRALDGAPAAAFLARVREILESPYLLLL